MINSTADILHLYTTLLGGRTATLINNCQSLIRHELGMRLWRKHAGKKLAYGICLGNQLAVI